MENSSQKLPTLCGWRVLGWHIAACRVDRQGGFRGITGYPAELFPVAEKHLRRVGAASARLRDAEARLDQRAVEFRSAVVEAWRSGGESQARIARAAGISRERVSQIIRGEMKGEP